MKNKSIEKVLKWFSMMEMKKLKEMENDPEWFSIMQNEKYKYPKTKKELFELKALYLCCFCNRVPKEISHIKNIKKLVVSFNGINGVLPKEIKYFKHLEELSLELTSLEKIHPNLYKLKKLKKLNLAVNSFNDIPKGISNLKNLEELNLGLYSEKLPKDIVQLKKLNTIKIDTNKLTKEQQKWLEPLNVVREGIIEI